MNTITGTIDPGVISMVKFFNENGLPTHMSCQGHNKTNMSMFWIEFDRSVTEDNILNFMKDHLNAQGTFVSCGRFASVSLVFIMPKPLNGVRQNHGVILQLQSMPQMQTCKVGSRAKMALMA